MSKLVGAHAMVFARGSRTTRAHALYMISSHVPKFPYRLAMLPITMRPCAIRVSTFPVPSFLFDRGRGFEIDSRGRAAGSGTRRFRSPKSAPAVSEVSPHSLILAVSQLSACMCLISKVLCCCLHEFIVKSIALYINNRQPDGSNRMCSGGLDIS